MKRFLLFLSFITISSALFFSCNVSSAPDLEPIVISGEVINERTEAGIENAIVQITEPVYLEQMAQTNPSGEYLFTDVQVDSIINVTVEATKEGFNTVTMTLLAVPERNIEVPPLKLNDGSSGGNGDEEGVSGEAAGPASITLESISSQTINVAETGGTVNSAFTFSVQDSAGRTVGSGYEMKFEIIRGPDGGESITPDIGETNSQGSVTSNLFSGDSSGTVRIEAVIERPDVGLTIRSSPVLVSISSGFPHSGP